MGAGRADRREDRTPHVLPALKPRLGRRLWDLLMSNTTQGPTWQTVAAVTGTVLMSIAVGAGGYFVTQQAARDARQDQMLDTFATKLVDISISMVQLRPGSRRRTRS